MNKYALRWSILTEEIILSQLREREQVAKGTELESVRRRIRVVEDDLEMAKRWLEIA